MKRNIPAACILLMMVCCTATYGNHFLNDFHFDDYHTVVNNAYIRNIHNVPLFFKEGKTSSILPANQSYRPVVTTSLAIDYWLGNGYNLFFFHLSTFIIFLLQGVGMVFLFKKIFDAASIDRNNIYIAIGAASWYLLHPAIAETVNYVIARSDLLSTFFVVVAFLLYIYSPLCRKTGLYLIAVVIGALAKPPAVMFAPILLIYILFFEEKLSLIDIFRPSQFHKTWQGVKRSLPAFVVCAAVYLLIDRLTPKTWVPGGNSPLQYLITQPFVILHYFYMLFFPVQLSVDTDWQLLPGIWDIRFFAGCLFILALLVTMIITSKKQSLRPISFGICWFFLALVPTSSIIPLAEVMNDHRMYFPFIGIMLSVCWAVRLLICHYLPYIKGRYPAYKKILIFVAVIILAGYAYGTWQRNNVWYSEETLWHDAVIKSPGSGRALMNYGIAQMGNNELPAAETSFKAAVKLWPTYDLIYVNLGILSATKGDTLAAENYFKNAIVFNRGDGQDDYYYGRFLNDRLRIKEAIQYLSKAIVLSPDNLEFRLYLMDIYQSAANWAALQQLVQSSEQLFPGNADIAVYARSAALKQNKTDIIEEKLSKKPDAAGYVNLSLMYYSAGQFNKCIAACQKALALKPGYDLAYNNICSAYNEMGEWDLAIQAGTQGLKANPNYTLLKNNLAAAYKGKSKALSGH